MNWGWRIAIFLTLFIGFIMYMVIYSFGVTSDLVADDYYNQEIQYQLNIDAQKNALPFTKEVSISSNSEKISVTFPESFDMIIEKGDISFYRPDNAKLDKSIALRLDSNNSQKINKKEIASGFYKVTIQFINKGKTYLINKEIWI